MIPGMICIVDDDPLVHFAVKKLIRSVAPEKEIISFSDGAEACAYLRNNAGNDALLPDAILLDLHTPYMPGMMFLELYAEMQPGLMKDICIYVISSTLDREEIAAATAQPHVKTFISKPVRKPDVERILEAIPCRIQ